MYRYSNRQVRGPENPERTRFRNRIKNLLILFLVIALTVLAVMAVPAIRYRNEAKSLYLGRAVNECDEAITQVSYLSRTAGTNAYSNIARIRSDVYAIQTLNELSSGMNGSSGRFVDQSALDAIFTEIDNFLTNAKNGSSTSTNQTNLQQMLESLLTTLSAQQ